MGYLAVEESCISYLYNFFCNKIKKMYNCDVLDRMSILYMGVINDLLCGFRWHAI